LRVKTSAIGLLSIFVLSSIWMGAGASFESSMTSGPTTNGLHGGIAVSGNGGNLAVTIHNTMSNATGAYQQPIEIDSSSLGVWINSNWTNGRVYNSSGAPVYAWIESGASNSSNDTHLWVKMASIPAGGWSNLTISFGPLSAFDLSPTGYMGEAPELSSSYGAFDNGAKVFNFYDNFGGNSLSSAWQVHGGWNYTVANGFSVSSVPGDGAAVITDQTFTYPGVVDTYGNLYESNPTGTYTGQGFGSGGCLICAVPNSSAVGWEAQTSLQDGPAPWAAHNASYENGSSVFPTQQFAVFTTEVVSLSIAYFQANYQGLQTLTGAIPPDPVPVIVAQTGGPPGPLTNKCTTTWIRERTYEVQMPTVKVSGFPESAVTFAASGLPLGMSWTVELGHATSSSTGPISFLVPKGTHSYAIGAITGFSATPSSGSVTVAGDALNVTIRFTASSSTSYYAVDFTETGLPSGADWTVTLRGTSRSASTNTIGFDEPNGSSSYSVDCGANSTASPSTGTVNVNGSIVAVSVVCQSATGGLAPVWNITFEPAGLPETLWWSITLIPDSPGFNILSTLSVTRSAIGEQTITFEATGGTYSYTTAASGYRGQSGTVEIGATAPAVVSLTFVPAPIGSSGPAPAVQPMFWAFGVVIFAIGALSVGAIEYRSRARQAAQDRGLVRGIAEIDWTDDGSGEPVPRVAR
jgi:hypothetical protein